MKVKALLYCTKAKPYLLRDKENKAIFLGITSRIDRHNYDTEYGMNCEYERECCEKLNGKIVAECDYEVEEIKPEKYWHSTEDFDYIYNTGTIYYDDLLKKSCLMDYELDDYLGCEDKGYAIHIKNLHIFDESRELLNISKAPQNMMKYLDENDNLYILISIRPEWLCKILNGEKTIEVRKVVLKEMLRHE